MFNTSENTTNAFSMNSSTDASNLNEGRLLSLDLVFFEKVFAGIDACLLPFIIFGNMLVLIAVFVEPKLQKISNAFIVSLAVSDLLVGVLTIPLYILFYLHVANMETIKYICLFRNSVGLCSLGSSLSSLLLMSFDRYLAVLYPIRYPLIMTPKRAKLAITVAWVFPILHSSLSFMGWNTWHEGITCDMYKVLPRAYLVFAIYVLISFALLVTTILYIRIFHTALTHQKRRRSASVSSSADFQRKQMKGIKSAKVMFVVLLLFALFWVPYLTCSALKNIKSFSWELIEIIKSFALCLAFSNSMANPIVYGILNKDFKVVFKRLLFSRLHCCKKDRL